MIKTVNKPLLTQPLKTSPATGASLASLGIRNSIPLMHGSQGCGAFAKVYLIQHLREPIPIQNTAIDQVSAVMGGDDNLYDALRLLCEKNQPELITVMTTGLTEMQGTDIFRVVATFKKDFPQYSQTRIVTVNTPDFVGTMQSGFALTVNSMVKQLVKPPKNRDKKRKQVNVLLSVALTSADIETIKLYLDAFNFDSIIVPDLSLSLDGHLNSDDFSPTSTGGTSVLEIELMSESTSTIVIGESMLETAKWLERRFDIPYFDAGLLMDMEGIDRFISYLHQHSGVSVPSWIDRARCRLQDAMLDTHFVVMGEAVSMALEPDLAQGYANLFASVGVQVNQIITTADTKNLHDVDALEIIVGGLNEIDIRRHPVKALIGNTHLAESVDGHIPVLRAGYPCHDRFGNMDVAQIGYQGVRQRLFALANLILDNHVEEVKPFSSQYRFSVNEVSQNKGAA